MLGTDPTILDLSAQQRLVLSLSATGLTSAAVATALHVPVHEVRAHLASAIQALGARSKLEAVLLADRHGLIEPPDSSMSTGSRPSDNHSAPALQHRGRWGGC
jgi:DNA-binding CsgD family transcriptional regulator